MIEVSVKTIDGVQFLDKVRITSWERRRGLPIQEVSAELFHYPLMRDVLKWLMLEEVDYDASTRVHYFAQRPVNDIVYRLMEFCYRFYWLLVRFLYDNARIFKQIPKSEPFSWRYFTPYCWLKEKKNR